MEVANFIRAILARRRMRHGPTAEEIRTETKARLEALDGRQVECPQCQAKFVPFSSKPPTSRP